MIVDDHEVVRLGLNNLLARQPGWQVVAEAGTAADAIQRADEYEPDVVLMDIRLGHESGIEACREIVKAHPDTKVIMLTSFAQDELLFNAISAGAVGYVLKQVGNDDLIRAIKTVAQGNASLDPGVTGQVLAKLRESTRSEAFAGLSDRELKVLALITQGKTNKEIATSLYLGEGTIRNYVSNILEKMGLGNRAEATAYAVRHNLDDYLKPSE
ncbi:MAG: response regulator transcription factor [Chloroflexi bacterium]|nr:DNA-binding response regulator [Chloroflexota bacterium]NOG66359.1 response regulator transcription factor [Chloroflexota bacterium]